MNSFSTNLEYHRKSYIAIILGKIVQPLRNITIPPKICHNVKDILSKEN